MKIKNTKRTNSKVIVLVIASLLILALIGTGIYAVKFNGTFFGWTPFKAKLSSTVDYSPPTEEQIDTGVNIKEDNASTTQIKTDTNTNKETSTSATQVSISIPYSDYYDPQDTSLHITTLIGKITSQGTCTLTLSRAGYTPIVMTAAVQAQASSSTCEGFTVPTSGVAGGVWNLRIDYVDGNNRGSISKDQQIK